MKKRLGFVSNSSSSSFVCLVSGQIESGMDAGLGDFEMCECTDGHVFGDQYLLTGIDVRAIKLSLTQDAERYLDNNDPSKVKIRDDRHREYLEKYFPERKETCAKQVAWVNNFTGDDAMDLVHEYAEEFGDYGDWRYETPSAFCPICSLTHVQDSDLLSYMLAVAGETREALVAKVQEKFSGLDALDAAVLGLNKERVDANAPATIGKTDETA